MPDSTYHADSACGCCGGKLEVDRDAICHTCAPDNPVEMLGKKTTPHSRAAAERMPRYCLNNIDNDPYMALHALGGYVRYHDALAAIDAATAELREENLQLKLKVAALDAECAPFRPMTMEEIDKAIAEAEDEPPEPEEKIAHRVRYVTDPVYRAGHLQQKCDEQFRISRGYKAEIDRLQTRLAAAEKLKAPLAYFIGWLHASLAIDEWDHAPQQKAELLAKIEEADAALAEWDAAAGVGKDSTPSPAPPAQSRP